MSRVGFIGVGEAGTAYAAGLREAGAEVRGYDACADDPAVAARAAAAGVPLASSLADLVDGCAVVINLTSAKVAVSSARAAAPLLAEGQLYADFNSASPEVMREAAEVVEAGGARFADGAVMAAVPGRRNTVPVLLSGSGADAVRKVLVPYGAQVEVLGVDPGQASAVKMLRSLLVKGLEALLVEYAAGAARYGVARRVLDSVNGTLPMHDWNALAEYLMSRSLEHAGRRAEELRQVASTLAAAGVEPLVAPAGARRLQWLADHGVPAGTDYDAVIARLARG
jgi:3-hydroxyisobutyrate dehydrogenase-like beta-hydroxyacid dehydrogenase